jgi:hypothetical protein
MADHGKDARIRRPDPASHPRGQRNAAGQVQAKLAAQ